MGSQSCLHKNRNKQRQEENSTSEEKIETEIALPKCKHPISIHTELVKVYASEDYWDFARNFFADRPLKGLALDQSSIDGLERIEKGIAAYQRYINFLMLEHPDLYCKQGFNDFAYAGFAKYNDPKRFKIFKEKFEQETKMPCAAFEEQKTCPALPEEQNSYYVGIAESYRQDGVEFYYGGVFI